MVQSDMSTATRIFLTGRPGIGKTTVVLRTVELLGDIDLVGFYTRECRQQGKRVGFEAVGLRTKNRCVLAEVGNRGGPRVGRYVVCADAFARFLVTEFDRWRDAQLVILDEVGKMECLVAEFVPLVQDVLASTLPVLGTVAERAGGFAAEVRRRPDVELIRVTTENRDRLPEPLVPRFDRR